MKKEGPIFFHRIRNRDKFTEASIQEFIFSIHKEITLDLLWLSSLEKPQMRSIVSGLLWAQDRLCTVTIINPYPLHIEAMQMLCDALMLCKQVTSLNLSDCFPLVKKSDDSTETFIDCLLSTIDRGFPLLEQCGINNCRMDDISETAIQKLMIALRNKTQLHTLSFSGSEVNEFALQCMTDIIFDHTSSQPPPTVRSLDLSECNLYSPHLRRCTRLLTLSTTLQLLNLSNNPDLFMTGFQKLSEESEKLESVSADAEEPAKPESASADAVFDTASMEAFVNALVRYPSLQELNLTGTSLNNDAIRYCAQLVLEGKTMPSSLFLGLNNFDDAVYPYLCMILSRGFISALNLEDSFLSSKTAKQLLLFVLSQLSVTSLTIGYLNESGENYQIGPDFFDDTLHAALVGNRSLKALTIDGYAIEVAILPHVFTALSGSHLEQFSLGTRSFLRDNLCQVIPSNIVQCLIKFINQNPSLKILEFPNFTIKTADLANLLNGSVSLPATQLREFKISQEIPAETLPTREVLDKQRFFAELSPEEKQKAMQDMITKQRLSLLDSIKVTLERNALKRSALSSRSAPSLLPLKK